jgi:flagellar biogenesis protein FliO
MRSLVVALLMSAQLGSGAQADTLEPIAAQGPSARTSERAPSAYQHPPKVTETTNEPIVNPVHTHDQGRRLTLSDRPDGPRAASRPAADRGAAMLTRWAKGSGVTALAALAFVIGLFMLLAWAMKRGMPKSSQVLPDEAVRILGRVPLGARQCGHLLQIGNKLVLVSVSQGGVEKLAEIDEPQEVVRLVALCGKTSSNGSQKEFEEIFGQFAHEKTGSGFLGSEASLFSASSEPHDNGGRRYA